MTKLLYQGHASVRITTNEGHVIYIDPFAGEGYDAPADLVLITHEHFDHNQVQLMPEGPKASFLRTQTIINEDGSYNTFDLFGVHIQPVSAYNDHHNIRNCCGLVLDVDGLRIYHAGDTSKTQDMTSGKLAEMNIDYALLPCDGHYNMNAAEASECAKLIGAKHSIPIHTHPVSNPNNPGQIFDPEVASKFEAEGRIILIPGQEIELQFFGRSVIDYSQT